MAQDSRPDAWDKSSRTLLTIKEKGGTARSFRTIITSTDKTGGVKDFDTIYNYAEGCIKNHKDVTPVEVTFEGYAVEVGTANNLDTSVGKGFDDLMNTADSSQPISVSLDNTRREFIVAFEKTTSTTATDALAITEAGDRAMRAQWKNGHFIDVASNDADGVIKYTLKYKITPFDREGNKNIITESTDGSTSATLPAIVYA